MRIIIVRNIPGEVISMDVCTNELVTALRRDFPDWTLVEIAPRSPLGRSPLSRLAKCGAKYLLYPLVLRRQHADLYHIIDHGYGHLAFWLRGTRKPIVITCHDVVNLIYPENLHRRSRSPGLSMLAWRLGLAGLHLADRIIAVSTATGQELSARLDIAPDRVSIIPNGVSPRFRPLPAHEVAAFRRSFAQDDQICMLNVGTVEPRKNMAAVLEVLRTLRERGHAVRLWKLGEPFSAEQQAIIQAHDLAPAISYLGFVTPTVLVQAYNAADALLAPSLYEGFGMTVLEAMACGTPVITSNVASLPQIAGAAAVLVDPHDTMRMAEAMLTIMEDQAFRRRLIDAGLAQSRRFSWQATARATAAIYSQLVQHGRNGPAVFHRGSFLPRRHGDTE